MWKFYDFSTTQILCDIKYSNFGVSKKNVSNEKLQKSPKSKFRAFKTVILADFECVIKPPK